MSTFTRLITLTVLLSLSWVTPVMAYIDPGSGSAIMSAIIGFFVAAGIALKTYWYKIKGIFTSKKTQDNDAESNDEAMK
ncbi:hypothetical protein SIN8267_02131 [Sinobacterium norvegicum]|uniref:Uncharacterized protein n=1 Tax=Sinobacterium norvegicum TaxID=1641715 RepID=A0ABM9AFP4_9GAMM|nr:hypothetical protein [Sinobacterium norvegicum]CAH0992016.1 hypothetical protein SIN8267_02131 [Sinobacterium norvegicum]